MLPISQLLERFKGLVNNDKAKKHLIVEILLGNNIPVNINQINIVKNIIFIKTPPIIKTEILLRKEEILNQIKKNSGLGNISNIQ